MAPSSLYVPIAEAPALLFAGQAGLVPLRQYSNGELPSVEYQQGAKDFCLCYSGANEPGRRRWRLARLRF